MPDLLTLKINLGGLDVAQQSISNFRAKLPRAMDQKSTKTAIGEILVARARRNIKEVGMNVPGGWKPIKKTTINTRWMLEQKKKPSKRVNKQGIVSNAPLQRTGAGLQSLNYNTTAGGLELSALKYMGWQHTGTKPYTIKPKTKKVLAIPGLGIFKHVNHPGLPARPFFTVTVEDMDAIGTMVIDEIKGMI